MLKTVVLLNIFMETMITFFKDYLMNTKLKGTTFIWNKNILQHYKYYNFWSYGPQSFEW